MTLTRLVTKVRDGYWHVWKVPGQPLQQTECSQQEYEELGTKNTQPVPPQKGWVWDHSFKGPVLSTGLQYLEVGDVFRDQQDYLVAEQVGQAVVYKALPLEDVTVDALGQPILVTPTVEVL